MTRGTATVQGIVLYLHCLPYLFLVSILMRPVVFSLTHAQWTWPDVIFGIASGIAFGITVGIAFGITGGIAFGIAFGIAVGIAVGIAFGITGGIAVRIAFAGGIAFGIAFGIAVGIAVGIAFGIAVGIGVGIAFAVGVAFGIAVGITGGIAFGIACGIAVGIAVLRAYYFVAHPLFLWPQARGGMYPYHPVAWDDLCSVPFPGLDRLLVAFAELHPPAGAAEVERIISSYPSQRTQALRARMILQARETKQVSTLVGLEEIAARLPQGQTALLHQSMQIAEGLHEIAMLQTRINTTERPVLRAAQAELLLKEIENFRHRIAGFKEPLASEFRGAASVWSKMVQKQLEEARRVLGRKPAEQVFRAGDPVKREQEAFVYRDAVAGRLDQQITLASGCPGIVLYARRRMGKSTFLTNLDGFLPSSVLIRSVPMQNANVVASLKHLVERISGGGAGDLAGLSIYLTHEDQRLGNEGRRLLLAARV